METFNFFEGSTLTIFLISLASLMAPAVPYHLSYRTLLKLTECFTREDVRAL
jgi:hypothetical protein